MNLKNFHAIVGALAQEFRETGLPASDYAQWSIMRMNSMYELPINLHPTIEAEYLGEPATQRLQRFLKTLNDEVREGLEVLAIFKIYENLVAGQLFNLETVAATVKAGNIEADRVEQVVLGIVQAVANGQERGLTTVQAVSEFGLVSMADWLADMRVFIESEAVKYGLPLTSVLSVVMGSNFTKLGADGLPIKDENGKFLKGPNFQKPEPAIHALLFGNDTLFEEANALMETSNDVSLVTQNVLAARNHEIFESAFGSAEDDEDLTEADEEHVQSDDGYIDHA